MFSWTVHYGQYIISQKLANVIFFMFGRFRTFCFKWAVCTNLQAAVEVNCEPKSGYKVSDNGMAILDGS